MRSSQKLGAPAVDACIASREGPCQKAWRRLASRVFARQPTSEAVETRTHFDASPEILWNRILFYEEVPGSPPLLLRMLLTCPRRTEGEKAVLGSRVRCLYTGGHLVKRITAVEPRQQLQFEVIEQKLGIESCVIATGGSYEIRSCNGGVDVALTTRYLSRLRPRALWRPLEKLVARRLHWHILNGMRSTISEADARIGVATPPPRTVKSERAGGYECTNSPSHLHR